MEQERAILKKFGARVRSLRVEKGYSQEELSERANLHRTYIGMIERGEKNVTLVNVQKLAKALGLSMNELLKPY